MTKRRKKQNKNLKKYINITIDIVAILAILIIFICIFNYKNIKITHLDKKYTKQYEKINSNKENTLLLESSKQTDETLSTTYIYLNSKNKELTICEKKEKEDKLTSLTVQHTRLKKVNNVLSTDIIKLELPSSLKTDVFAYYINLDEKNTKIYFSFTDKTTYTNEKNITIPMYMVEDLVEKNTYNKILELTQNNITYDYWYSELIKNIIIFTKKENKITDISYETPYIVEGSNISANNINNILEQYKTNYNNTIDIRNVSNSVYNTRNTHSKYVTVINASGTNIINIRPSGKLFNVLFEPKNIDFKNSYKIN